MNKNVTWLIVTTSLVFFAGIFLSYSELSEYCYTCAESSGYSRYLGTGVGEPLLFMSTAILISLVPLYFVRKSVFKAWSLFALSYVPLAMYATFKSPTLAECGDFCLSDITTIAKLMSVLFLVISLLIIIIKSWKLSSEPEKQDMVLLDDKGQLKETIRNHHNEGKSYHKIQKILVEQGEDEELIESALAEVKAEEKEE